MQWQHSISRCWCSVPEAGWCPNATGTALVLRLMQEWAAYVHGYFVNEEQQVA
jgi:hypothetical protein